jgi:hypothetical protein
MVHVDDDVEVVAQGRGDGEVDPLEERFVDAVWRTRRGVARPAHRQAHGVEARFLGEREEAIFEAQAPVAFLRRLEHVAEIDAAARARAGRWL